MRTVLSIAAAMLAFANAARADIFQWEYVDPADPSQGKRQSTTLAPDGAGVNAVPGAILSYRNLTMAYLIGADLTGADGQGAILTNADLTLANLTNAFFGATLSGVDLSQANLTGAYFVGANLTDANLSQANLANARFASCRPHGCARATLVNSDLTAADARGGFGLEISDLSGATTDNLIWSDGHIDRIDLEVGGLLVVRDYDARSDEYDNNFPSIPITVDQHLAMGPAGTLRMVFEADAWDSKISFAPGIPVTLGGTLELTFAADVNPASQVGRTFDLFDWTGVTPAGTFIISSPYAWNLSNLYTTGEVTLISIPEPTSTALAAAGAVGLTFYRRRKNP
jgi:uncharacterized protein YjbI with pentapeptide repeats